MKEYKELVNMFNEIISQNYLFNDIKSIYLYGSLAQSDFEEGYSDIDLWIIIKDCDDIEERINITRKIVDLIDIKIEEYLDNIHNNSRLKKYHYHGNWYFSESEFIEYVKLYPTRVLYPIVHGIWRNVYGYNYVDEFLLPEHKDILQYLMLDFELFVREIEGILFTNKPRELIKYTMRAMKKALWIIDQKYIKNRNMAVQKSVQIFPNNNLFVEFKALFGIAQKNNYELDAKQQMELSVIISNIINFLAREINIYIDRQNIKLIREHQVIISDLWGNFLWSFTEILTDYINIKKGDKKKLLLYVTESYYKIIRYYSYVIRYKIPMDKYFGKKELPLKNSILNNGLFIDELRKDDIYAYEGAEYLLETHMQMVVDKSFLYMNESEIRNYIEKRYLKEIYKLFSEIREIHKKA